MNKKFINEMIQYIRYFKSQFETNNSSNSLSSHYRERIRTIEAILSRAKACDYD